MERCFMRIRKNILASRPSMRWSSETDQHREVTQIMVFTSMLQEDGKTTCEAVASRRAHIRKKVDHVIAKLFPAQRSKSNSTSACFFFLSHILLSRPSKIPLLNSIRPGPQPGSQLRPHIPEAAEIESALLIQATKSFGAMVVTFRL